MKMKLKSKPIAGSHLHFVGKKRYTWGSFFIDKSVNLQIEIVKKRGNMLKIKKKTKKKSAGQYFFFPYFLGIYQGNFQTLVKKNSSCYDASLQLFTI